MNLSSKRSALNRLSRTAVVHALWVYVLGAAGNGAFAQDAAQQDAGAIEPFRVTGVEITAEGDAAVVRITGDGSLVWSRVHKIEDQLLAVVVPDAILPSPVETRGQHPLIVKAQSGPSPAERRKAVMVAVSLSQPANYVLDVEGGELLLRLDPRAAPPMAAGASPSSASSIDSRLVPKDPLGLAGAELLLLDESIGTAARPFLGPSPEGPPATRLLGLEQSELEGRRGYFLRGDGDFSYSCFFLPGPDRFAIDLSGVRNVGGSEVLVVDGDPLVRQVRTAQFKRFPDPITRVVFDLNKRGKVRTLRTNEGLFLFFE